MRPARLRPPRVPCGTCILPAMDVPRDGTDANDASGACAGARRCARHGEVRATAVFVSPYVNRDFANLSS